MTAPTREEFERLVGTYEAQAYDHGYCEGCASYDDEGLSGARRTAGRAEGRVKTTGAALVAAYDAVCAERDHAGSLIESICPECGPCKFTDEDGCCKTCGETTFMRLSPTVLRDPRIEAWGWLGVEWRGEAISALRINGYDAIEDKHDAGAERVGRAWLIAADALEALALAERP